MIFCITKHQVTWIIISINQVNCSNNWLTTIHQESSTDHLVSGYISQSFEYIFIKLLPTATQVVSFHLEIKYLTYLFSINCHFIHPFFTSYCIGLISFFMSLYHWVSFFTNSLFFIHLCMLELNWLVIFHLTSFKSFTRCKCNGVLFKKPEPSIRWLMEDTSACCLLPDTSICIFNALM